MAIDWYGPDYFNAPPLSTLKRTFLEDSPYPANDYYWNANMSGVPLDQIRGLYLVATTIPVGWGRYVGWRGPGGTPNMDTFEGRLWQLVMATNDKDGFPTVVHTWDGFYQNEFVAFSAFDPVAYIGLHVVPGVEVGGWIYSIQA